MKISFERSGGFAGLILATAIDTQTLSSAESEQIHQIMDVDFFGLPKADSSSQPDRFHYQITVEEGDRQHTVEFGESTMPDSLRPLVDWMLERCKQT
jgi:hypothetical protein